MTTSGTAAPTAAADADAPEAPGPPARPGEPAGRRRRRRAGDPRGLREPRGQHDPADRGARARRLGAVRGLAPAPPWSPSPIAMAWSGGWTDRAGPRPVLLWGMAAFVVAQVVSALAPTMSVFVAGRAASGAAEALIDTALMVLVAQALPEALRAKVFASFAAAWILPSLLGPSLAGAIDALWGWRAGLRRAPARRPGRARPAAPGAAPHPRGWCDDLGCRRHGIRAPSGRRRAAARRRAWP